MHEHRKETELYQDHGEWTAAQEHVKRTYFMNIQQNKFEQFLIHGFIASIGILLLMIVLCIAGRKHCCGPQIRIRKRDME